MARPGVTRVRICSALLIGAAVLCHGGHASAQDASDSREKAEQDQEIVVTAQRRETRLLDTPLSIAAFSGKTLEENRVLTLDDLARLAPGVSYIPLSTGTTYLTIRGASIGDDAPGADTGVTLFVNDIVTTGTADTQPQFFDLDRIEVLRGPQGTLFGRNVTGGAVLVYSRKASFETEIRGEATAGSMGLFEAKASLTGPLSGTVAGKLVLTATHLDRESRNAIDGSDVGGQNLFTVSGQILARPSENAELRFDLDYLREDSPGGSTQLYGNYVPTLAPEVSYDPDLVAKQPGGHRDRNVLAATLRADVDLSLGTLTSISGYRRVRVDSGGTTVPAAVDVVRGGLAQRDEQFSQELRIASSAGGRFGWVGGAYFLKATKHRISDFTWDFLPGSVYGTFFGDMPYDSRIDQKVRLTSLAAFGELSFEIVDSLTLAAGGRLTWEKKSGTTAKTLSDILFGGPIAASYSQSWDAFTPKVTLTYKPAKDVTLYVLASKGFKSGGFNYAGNTAQLLATPFNPETVWNYEAGIKFAALDNNVRGAVSAYWSDYKDLQVLRFISITDYATFNAGEARVRGVEADLSVRPVNWLTLSAAYAYTDTKFLRYDAGGIDYSGNEQPFTPRHQLTLNSDLTIPKPILGGDLSIGASASFRSKVWFDDANSSPQLVRNLSDWPGIFNAHVDWASQDGKYRISFWAKNITDRNVLLYASDISPYYLTFAEAVTQPNAVVSSARWYQGRRLGVTLSARW